MSIRIALTDAPEFYTNLDIVTGKVILGINRPEQIGAIIVKLEGESKTALGTPDGMQEDLGQRRRPSDSGQVLHENHKILYKVLQVFPDEDVPAYMGPVILQPGQHEWPFRFKVPFNNGCSDPASMAKIGGFAGAGGFAGPSIFGLGGIRVMDGSKQLLYTHVTKTLPPSFTGFPREAEIRYYIKVTIQRPGLFKENWRYQTGLKFLPIEPPRPAPSNQEAYARRPFVFKQRSVSPNPPKMPKRSSIFSKKSDAGQASSSLSANDAGSSKSTASFNEQHAPSIEMSARIPHPSILTCNKPIPLRILSKKLTPTSEECYLVSLQIDLIGSTIVRCQDLINTETTRWVVVSQTGLSIPLQKGPGDAVNTETAIDSALWSSTPLPNTVMPSFVTCNLSRSYQIEIKLGVCWGKPPSTSSTTFKLGKGKQPMPNLAQTIYLPLHFSSIEVYSGLTPPESLVKAMRQAQQAQQNGGSKPRPPARPNAGAQSAPVLPTRPQQAPRPQSHNPLYPPQLRPGQTPIQAQVLGAGGNPAAAAGAEGAAAPAYVDEAPPSYDEAMGDATGPVIPAGEERPAYSGVTNENAPDSLPEKS